MLLRRYSLIFFSLLCAFIANPQSPNLSHGNLLDFKPPAPNAASLGKFGDIPVNYNTGIPSISIPVYSYKSMSTGLSLIISLSYHAGGLRLQEKASNVGIGWALNAGGVITRQVRGGPDEGGAGYTGYWSAGALPDIADYQANENMYGTTTSTANPYFAFHEGFTDAEPDVFTFNIGGRSGKFIIGKNNEAIIYSKDKIEITRTLSGNVSFILKTEDGVKYIFDQQENVSHHKDILTYYYGNSWYLSKIVAPFSTEEINFAYSDYYTNYLHLFSQTLYKKMSPSSARLGFSGYVNNMSYQAKRLTSITLPNGVSVSFTYDNIDRCDYAGDKALKKIEISDGATTKGIKLKQNYSFGPYSDPPSNCNGLDPVDTRLVLHKVIEYAGTKEFPPYLIEYDNSLVVPGTMSYAVDHWGFFNGKYSNSSWLPYNGTGIEIAPAGSVDNADRRVNPAYSKAGTIKKITFPTGGYTEFTFESNDIPVEASHPVYDPQPGSTSINGLSGNNYVLFNLQRDIAGPTSFKFEFGGFSPANANCTMQASITSVDDATTYATVTLGPGQGYSKTQDVSIPTGQYKYKYAFVSQCVTELFVVALNWTNVVSLPQGSSNYAGGLRIKKIVENTGTGYNIKTREYRYVKDDGQTSSGVISRWPEYVYSYAENCNSNNCLGGCLDYNHSYTVISGSSLFNLSNGLGSPVLYTRVEELFTGDGNANNGKIVRTYTTTATSPTNGFPFDAFNPAFMVYPYITPQPLDWIYGNLLSEATYDANNTLKHKIENSYFFGASSLPSNIKQNFKGIKVYKDICTFLKSPLTDCNTVAVYNRFKLNDYYPVIGLAQLQASTENTYTENGTAITKVTNYEYDPDYYALSKVKAVDSKGITIEERLYYPYNYTTGGMLSELVNTHHIFTPVVSKEVWRLEPGNPVTKKLIGGEITEFVKFNNIVIKPFKKYSFISAIPVNENVVGVFNPNQLVRNATYFKPIFQFDKYDNKGNLIEQKKTDDIPYSYIWDYNTSHVIAEVMGADGNSVAYTSFEADGTGGWTINGSTAIDATSPGGSKCYDPASGTITRSGLSNATYIISYWGNSGSVTINGIGPTRTGESIGSWTYYEHEITTTSVTVSGSNLIDELRLYPKGAKMAVYAYSPLKGLIRQFDANNKLLHYEYDGFGRLIMIRDKDQNILKKICYNYFGQPEDCSVVYYNIAMGKTFYPSSCPPGYVPEGYFYSVAAGQYSSTASQMAADALAIAEINANGQNHANLYGCIEQCPGCTQQGPMYKCVNGQCEMGFKVYTYQWNEAGTWFCQYHWEFSDGSWGEEGQDTSGSPCM